MGAVPVATKYYTNMQASSKAVWMSNWRDAKRYPLSIVEQKIIPQIGNVSALEVETNPVAMQLSCLHTTSLTSWGLRSTPRHFMLDGSVISDLPARSNRTGQAARTALYQTVHVISLVIAGGLFHLLVFL